MNTGLLSKYVRLTRKKKVLQAQLDEVTSALDEAQEVLLSEFAQEGLEKVRVTVDEQPATLYPRTDAWPRLRVSLDKALPVLEKHGLDFVVTTRADSNKLRSWAAELRREGRDVPDDLAQIIDMNQKYRIGVSVK